MYKFSDYILLLLLLKDKYMNVILKATLDNAEVLTEITKKSKAHWGYSNEQLEEWSQILTVTPEYIKANPVYKLVVDNFIAGYYSYINQSTNEVLLDNLFVLPSYIGRGYGKFLLTDFINRVKTEGIKKIVLEADPNAEMFYSNFGFVRTGEIVTGVKDRYLPIMELNI
jgi:GNAT superfamily N-acetyltransferase